MLKTRSQNRSLTIKKRSFFNSVLNTYLCSKPRYRKLRHDTIVKTARTIFMFCKTNLVFALTDFLHGYM